ncbi:MAG: SurA N-terminal domain-containing protein [Deltaproteobacteria bacterium]|nr:SurA N-terminal domain-containing protein [Deltaproteobacteria bacterium]
MKFLRPFILVLFFCSVAVAAAQTDFQDRIVAVVNSDVITLSELNAQTEELVRHIDTIPPGMTREAVEAQTRKNALDRLINDYLVEQEARKLGMAVTDAQVDRSINDLLVERRISMEQFKQALARDRDTLEAYRDSVRQYLLRAQLINLLIRPKVTITEEEIGDYYRAHLDLYEGKEAVRLSQILLLFPRDAGEPEKKAVIENARAILERLKRGESFELMVSLYSQGPAAREGGDLGFVERNMMFPAVDEAAFRLARGEVSDVIVSPIGCHIIVVTDRRGAGVKPIDAVRDEIIARIRGTKVERKFQEWLAEVREKAHVDIRL